MAYTPVFVEQCSNCASKVRENGCGKYVCVINVILGVFRDEPLIRRKMLGEFVKDNVAFANSLSYGPTGRTSHIFIDWNKVVFSGICTGCNMPNYKFCTCTSV